MKKLNLAVTAVLVLALGGCSTVEERAARERIYDKQLATAKEYTPTPACQLIANDNQQITITGMKSFTCYGETNKTAQIPVYNEPESLGKTVFNGFLRTLEVVINPLTSYSIHKDNNATQRHASDNAVKTYGITMDTVKEISITGTQQLGTTASEGINVGRTPTPTAEPISTPVIP